MTTDTPRPTRLDVPAVLAALTLEEKAALLDGSDAWRTEPVQRTDGSVRVPAVMVADGPHGLRKEPEDSETMGLGDSVPATCFPPAAGLASTWDPDLVQAVGAAIADECRAQGVSVLLGPGVNMKRSPLCGRNFEYLSEDPFLAGVLAAALVRGTQGRGVGTSLKHFAANNQETQRMTISADVDDRTLREIYLPAFERVVRQEQPWTVMCAYNKVNGVYASQNHWLLTEVLREQWGFEGLVVSDWGAVDDRPAGVAAGLDLEMPSSGGNGTRKVVDAVRAGTLDEADVDRAAERVLRLVDRSQPALAEGGSADLDAHHDLARRAAVAAAVLLKNEDGILPLDPASRVAVVGELARTPRYQGSGSSQVNPTRLEDALGALRERLSGDVPFAPGYVLEPAADDDADVAAALRQEAVDVAREAGIVVVFLGLPPSYEAEGYDRAHMDLPPEQVALLDAVAAVNRDVVVVLSNGAAVTVHPWQRHARAVLEGWLLGQAGGSAVADLLTGRAAPSGRLAETIPLRATDTPTVGAFPGEHGHVRYGEGLLIGYRWYDAHALPVAYPFGHGLTYTRFTWSDVEVVVRRDTPAAPGASTHTADDDARVQVQVQVTVTNAGDRVGRETVQVYVADPEASVHRPEQELRGFAGVALEPGESRRVTVDLDARAFAFWHVPMQRWVVEAGAFEVRLGASSRDLRGRAVVQLAGDGVTEPLSPEQPTSAWLEHPVAGPVLRERLAGSTMLRMFEDPQHGPMLRAIPLRRLTRFPDVPVREEQLDDLLAEVADRPTA
ncbi:glycoside hydrolase family 3 C-terminal domain-containing protein [Actinotalea sp. Marseille-Q4924]|uniref:glycoside hydrolase family 3 C-terminal domain-containing protein n=1 Tax=Actinotalea sp. Marseille-Q4924 TaxID=2866571 RepID=UPI001CE3D653|nr:glycoside hydrolase family 3 C-terminal domain-containing protein [Actinotalea sp. Marseille-Q4924]